MTKRICIIQRVINGDDCPYYTNGINDMKDEFHRANYPCSQFLNSSCEMPFEIASFFGEPASCLIEKGQRIRKGVKDG